MYKGYKPNTKQVYIKWQGWAKWVMAGNHIHSYGEKNMNCIHVIKHFLWLKT